jgi:AcrR family transcriptional regulator
MTDVVLGSAESAPRRTALPLAERRRVVLDAAAELFYGRGVNRVGMDELVRATGLGKATVYRMFPTKDDLIGAYLRDRAERILTLVDADVAAYADDPAGAVRAVLDAVSRDVAGSGFRGCAFHNASVEFPDPDHPARAAARDYRAALRDRLQALGTAIRPGPEGLALGDALALLVDGMYVSAAHLGPDGPAAQGPLLAGQLLRQHGASA